MVILLCGVSGAGKTYLRQNSYLADFPHVDIADVYKEYPGFDWFEATHMLIRKVRDLLETHEQVVIEGYFLPGTKSRRILGKGLAGYDGQVIFMHASYDVCEKNIVSSGQDVELRLEMLGRRWAYADRAHKKGVI